MLDKPASHPPTAQALAPMAAAFVTEGNALLPDEKRVDIGHIQEFANRKFSPECQMHVAIDRFEARLRELDKIKTSGERKRAWEGTWAENLCSKFEAFKVPYDSTSDASRASRRHIVRRVVRANDT